MDLSELSFFTRDGDRLVPTHMAKSLWADNHMHGVAQSAALARAAEVEVARLGREDLIPARFAVDLFRPAAMAPCDFEVTLVRESSRLCLLDVVLRQGGEAMARAGSLFLKPTESAPGEVWSPTEREEPPPLDVAPETETPRVPFYASELPWSQAFFEHQNAGRKRSWSSCVPVLPDEPLTVFQSVAGTADGASMVSNWGSGGVQYINTDLTLTLSRRPVSIEIGLVAENRIEHDGIAVGVVGVFDRRGPLGSVTVTSLSNARRGIDFGEIVYTDDGERRASPGA